MGTLLHSLFLWPKIWTCCCCDKIWDNKSRAVKLKTSAVQYSYTALTQPACPVHLYDKDLQDTQFYQLSLFIFLKQVFLSAIKHIALLHCICLHLSLLASICIEEEPRLPGDQGCSVAWYWAVAWVWQFAVEARPPFVSSALTAFIRESLGGVFFSTELGKSLFPL